jgi:alcohol dehydrogenase YqhD (iron-dependent ADH family)
MKTRLRDYGIGESTINEIELRLSKRPGFDKLGERQNLCPERVRILLIEVPLKVDCEI